MSGSQGLFELPDSLVSTEWLQKHLDDSGLAVIDIRGYVISKQIEGAEPGHEKSLYTGAPDEFQAGHIPGSVYIDWTKDIVDLADPVPAQIASPEDFAAAMGSRGIGNDTAVVAVDHTGGHFAARLWWALKFFGHDRVAILDGGWNKWVSEGRPVTTADTRVAPAEFMPVVRGDLRATADDVLATVERSNAVIVDARDAVQFRGETWRGARKGHIPGAVNLSTKALLNSDGTWKPDDELAALIAAAGITTETPVVAYCNGGVTATGVLFALDRLGHTKWSNYDGSWNEWGAREELPVEREVPGSKY